MMPRLLPLGPTGTFQLGKELLKFARDLPGVLVNQRKTLENHQLLMGLNGIMLILMGYLLVNKQKMENHHFSWANQLFLWSFLIAMLAYQRVDHNSGKIPMGSLSGQKNHKIDGLIIG